MKKLLALSMMFSYCFAQAATPTATQLLEVTKNPESLKPDFTEKRTSAAYPYPTLKMTWEPNFLGGVLSLNKSTRDKNSWFLTLAEPSRYPLKSIVPQYKVLGGINESKEPLKDIAKIDSGIVFAYITSGEFKDNYLGISYMSGKLLGFYIVQKSFIYGIAKASKDQSTTYLIETHPFFMLLSKRDIFCKSTGAICPKI